MRLKSYFAGTVEAAMALARQELGPEAMLVNSRRASSDGRHLGEYEVVFASVPEEENTVSAEPDRQYRLMATRLSEQIGDLKLQVERISSNFARARFANSYTSKLTPEANRILAMLLDAGVDDEIAGDLARDLSSETSPSGALCGALEQVVRFDSSLGKPGETRRIIALTGPPGSGKTTTLVKLAARYAVASRRPAHIISADSVRIAASDQLRSYSAILGLGFQSVETPHALSMALEEHRQKDTIFIDTPGLSARDMEEEGGLAAFLSGHGEIDVHLVAPASMRAADLQRTIDRYLVFGPHKLIFTKLDETGSPGVLINEASRTNLPISFITTGQKVPEDLQPAGISLLTELITRKPGQLAAQAGA
jgi:flagellar biosynthesis protein FlhF